MDKACRGSLVVRVGVALHQLSHTYCENVGAALGLLADRRGRVGGGDGLDAHLPLAYAGGGGDGGGVIAERAPAVGRLGSHRDGEEETGLEERGEKSERKEGRKEENYRLMELKNMIK